MAFWMNTQFRTALPQAGSNVMPLQTYSLEFKISNAKDLHDTTFPTWAKRIQAALNELEGVPENWPVQMVGLEIVNKEEETQ